MQRAIPLLILFFTLESFAAVDSLYTKVLQGILEKWPPAPVTVKGLEEKAVQVRVFETPENIDYIGTELAMTINAPLNTVEKIVEGVEHYIDLLPGFNEIKVVGGDKNQFDVFWEKIIPVFFVKNVKYTVTYTVNKSKPDRLIYKTQLKEEKGLRALDGLVVLEKKGNQTYYYECAFFDGDFGMISSLAPKMIWKESLEAILHGALAKKLKAEKPQMPYEDIMKQVKLDVQTYPIEKLVESKNPHPSLLEPS